MAMEILQILDTIKLPFEIPLLKHPIAVHFAIAVPIIALLLEVVNLFIRRRCVGVISSLLLLLATGIYLAAFFTGKVDGKEAYALLSEAGKAELKEHKELGMYLVYGIGGVFLLKLIIAGFKSGLAKLFFVLVLAAFVGFSIKQGKDGGELVYEYGANVKAVSALDDKIMELEEQLEECKTPKAVTKTQEEAAQPQESTKQETPQASSSLEAQESSQNIEEKAKAALEEIKGESHQEETAQETTQETSQETTQSAATEENLSTEANASNEQPTH